LKVKKLDDTNSPAPILLSAKNSPNSKNPLSPQQSVEPILLSPYSSYTKLPQVTTARTYEDDILTAIREKKEFTITSKGLQLDNKDLGDEEAKIIAVSLNKGFTQLSLRGNKIGNQGAEYIATALKNNKTLKSLNLKDNNISDEYKKKIKESWGNRSKNLLFL